MKNLKSISTIIIIAFAIFISSCKKEPTVIPPKPNQNIEATLDLGTKVNASFFGFKVIDSFYKFNE